MEKQIQLAEKRRVWLYVAIDIGSNVVLYARFSERDGTEPAAAFLVDRMGYLTAPARTNLDGDLNYSERNIVEKLFQIFTMRTSRPRDLDRQSASALGPNATY